MQKHKLKYSLIDIMYKTITRAELGLHFKHALIISNTRYPLQCFEYYIQYFQCYI